MCRASVRLISARVLWDSPTSLHMWPPLLAAERLHHLATLTAGGCHVTAGQGLWRSSLAPLGKCWTGWEACGQPSNARLLSEAAVPPQPQQPLLHLLVHVRHGQSLNWKPRWAGVCGSNHAFPWLTNEVHQLTIHHRHALFGEISVQNFCPFSIGLVVFLLFRVLYIFWVKALCQIRDEQTFPPSLWLVFLFF